MSEFNEKDEWDAIAAEGAKGPPEEIVAAEQAATEELEQEEVEVVEKPSTPEAPPAPAPDPLAEIKAHLQRIEESTSKQMRDLNGRFGGLSEQMKQVATEATVAKAAAAPAQQAAIAEASKSPEKWEAFKKEWEGSGFVESIEEYVTSQLGKVRPAADPAQLVEEKLAAARADLDKQYAEREAGLRREIVDLRMNQVHPGWKETVRTKEFNTWRAAQPAEVQRLASSERAEDAIRMLDLYKLTAAPPAADKTAANRERLQQAVNPVRAEKGPRKTLSLDDMTPEQLWAYENRRYEAIAKPRAN